jgi:hypothetical protein
MTVDAWSRAKREGEGMHRAVRGKTGEGLSPDRLHHAYAVRRRRLQGGPMHEILIVATAVFAVCVALGTALVVGHRQRRRAAQGSSARPEPRSVVRLLTSDAELKEAVERASRFERAVAELLESRAARYESLLSPPSAPGLRFVPPPDAATEREDAEPTRQPRPA